MRGDLFAGDFHVRSFWTNADGITGNVVQYQGERTLDAINDTDVVDVEAEIPKAFDTGPVHHQFIIGGGWRYKGLRSGYLAGGFDKLYVENHFSAFANEQATFGKFSLVGSLRVDVHPLIDISQTTSPRAALLWRLFEKPASDSRPAPRSARRALPSRTSESAFRRRRTACTSTASRIPSCSRSR